MRRFLVCAAAAISFLGSTVRTHAVIEIKNTVENLYQLSEPVVLGQVTEVNGEQKALTIKTTDTIKGKPFPDQFRLVLADADPATLKAAAVDQPVVVLGSKAKPTYAVLHVAGTWFLAMNDGKTPIWRGKQMQDNMPRTFPGSTPAFVKVINEIKAGKPTLLNKVDNQRLMGGVKEIGKVSVGKPAFLASADVNGDGKPDLLVGGADGVKLLLNTGSGFEDATAKWLPAGASGMRASFADVNKDGKVDLLLGKTLFLNDGQKFTAGGTLDVPDGSIAAEALIDVNGDAKPDAVVLLADGQLLTFTNLGVAGQPWARSEISKIAGPVQSAVFGDFGDDGKPCAIVVTDKSITRYILAGPPAHMPSEFFRLTGEKLEIQKIAEKGIANTQAGLIDLNGDKRQDVIITGEEGSLVMVNRGFGTFLVDPDPSRVLSGQGDKAVPFKVTAATPWTSADLAGDGAEEIIVLSADGKLLAIENPPVK